MPRYNRKNCRFQIYHRFFDKLKVSKESETKVLIVLLDLWHNLVALAFKPMLIQKKAENFNFYLFKKLFKYYLNDRLSGNLKVFNIVNVVFIPKIFIDSIKKCCKLLVERKTNKKLFENFDPFTLNKSSLQGSYILCMVDGIVR